MYGGPPFGTAPYADLVDTTTVPTVPTYIDAWYTPIELPPRAKERDRRNLFYQGYPGDLPRAETINPDKWYTPMRLPPVGPAPRFAAQVAMNLGDTPRSETINTDKWHTPMLLPPKGPGPRFAAQVDMGLGGVVHEDETPPTWFFTPLSQVILRAEKDRRLLMPVYSLGQEPTPEVLTADKWISETRLPIPRRRQKATSIDFSTDFEAMSQQEQVNLDKYHVPMDRVVLARKTPIYVPDSAIVQDEVFPEDPVSYSTLPWDVAMRIPPFAVRTRQRREFYPQGVVLLGVDSLADEKVNLDKYHVPMGMVPGKYYRRPTPPLPIGGVDLDDAQRAESIFLDAFAAIDLPPWQLKKAASFFAATLAGDPANLVEVVHFDSFQTSSELPRAVRQVLTMAWQESQSAILESSNYTIPLIIRLRHWMLAAGLWRARY